MAYIARGDEELFSNYVVVSGVDDFYVCETYIFPADERGNVLDWGELPGSFQGVRRPRGGAELRRLRGSVTGAA